MEKIFTIGTGIDLATLRTSMQLESGTLVARLEDGDAMAELVVAGDVRVDYCGQTYRTPAKFPEGLMDAFEKGTDDKNRDIRVDSWNWFEMFVSYKDTDGEWKSDDDGDVIDDGPFTADELQSMLQKAIDQYRACLSD